MAEVKDRLEKLEIRAGTLELTVKKVFEVELPSLKNRVTRLEAK